MILKQIGNIYRALDSIANVEFKEIGLTKGQYAIVRVIGDNPGILAREISNELMIDEATLSRIVSSLEKKQLIEKRLIGDNLKNKHLYLLEPGMIAYKQVKAENSYSSERTLKGLTEEEEKQLIELLNKIEKPIREDWVYVKKNGKREY